VHAEDRTAQAHARFQL